jgi:polyisoprenoid-binding protein YceI
MLKSTAFALLAFAGSVLAAPQEMQLDADHTSPMFEVRHLGISTQRGRFNKTAGKVLLDLDAETANVDITIDARSVTTGSDALDRLLRGKEYFAVDEFPAITFKSAQAPLIEGKTTTIEGELTFLGVTKKIPLKVVNYACTRRPLGVLRCGADLTTTFKRSDFGLTAMQSFVGDDVTVLIQAEAVAKPSPPAPDGK